MTPGTDERIRLGISACLLGHPVRFDGGHKRDPFLVESLGQFVDWVPVCPEVESGMGAPREPVSLVQARDELRLLTNTTGEDRTGTMREYARRRIDQLGNEQLSGFVLKGVSPSCGLVDVKVFDTDGVQLRLGRGLFAEALVERFPLLPVEDEGRLNDPQRRENFIERIFAYRRLMVLFGGRWSMSDVVRFHSAHKLTLMAHLPEAYRRLGRLVAQGTSLPRRDLQDHYSTIFMTALASIATPGRHANVLHHMLGYFKQTLDSEGRAELLALINDYADGRVPLAVPLTLFDHHIRRLGVRYLASQTYLQPDPVELMLRRHV